jgi:hypothetical protein
MGYMAIVLDQSGDFRRIRLELRYGNLVVEDGTIMSSLIRASGTAHEEAWVVCVKADGAEQRDIVKAAIEAARSVVPHQWDENRATETETYRCSSKLPKSTPRSLPITLN